MGVKSFLLLNWYSKKIFMNNFSMKEFRKNSPKEFSERILWKNSLKEISERIFWENSLKEFSERIFWKKSLKEFSQKILQKNSPIELSERILWRIHWKNFQIIMKEFRNNYERILVTSRLPRNIYFCKIRFFMNSKVAFQSKRCFCIRRVCIELPPFKLF